MNLFKKRSRKEDIALRNQRGGNEKKKIIQRQMVICEMIRTLQYDIKKEMLTSKMEYLNFCIANDIVNKYFDAFDYSFIYKKE